MGYTSPSNITSFGVPQLDGTIRGYTFDNQNSVVPSLPGATIGVNGWYPSAQTPGGTPNPVAAASGLNWPSPGAVGVPAGATSTAGGSTISDYLVRGAVFLLGLVFVGGGVAMFGRK